MKRVCVFCGANIGTNPDFAAAARDLGQRIAERGWELVYGGGGAGMMGTIADSAISHGGRVIGVIPKGLATKELAHQGITEQNVVDNMHERKAMMADLADGFIALPGGFGTFEELFEAVTWAQLGIHRKPVAVLNVSGYYDPLIAMIDQSRDLGFVRPEFRQLFMHDVDAEALLERFVHYEPPELDIWMTSDDM